VLIERVARGHLARKAYARVLNAEYEVFVQKLDTEGLQMLVYGAAGEIECDDGRADEGG
jgi:hypothetical protein